jgi:hypothetical protein
MLLPDRADAKIMHQDGSPQKGFAQKKGKELRRTIASHDFENRSPKKASLP